MGLSIFLFGKKGRTEMLHFIPSEILEGMWERDRRRNRGNDVRGTKIREMQKGRENNLRD